MPKQKLFSQELRDLTDQVEDKYMHEDSERFVEFYGEGKVELHDIFSLSELQEIISILEKMEIERKSIN